MKSLRNTLGFALLLTTAVVLLAFGEISFAMPVAAVLGFAGFALLAVDHVLTNRNAPSAGWATDNLNRTGDPCNFGLIPDWVTRNLND